jgi:hypothetical protein
MAIADGQPMADHNRIPPAHPVPEAKGGGDAKGIGFRHVGGQRSKVAGNVGAALRLANQALAERALVMVSMVVKVLLAPSETACSQALNLFSTAASSWPSTFDTK